MAATDVTRSHDGVSARPSLASRARRLTTETKASFKTSELYAYVAVLAGVLIAGALTNGDDGPDHLIARQAWLFAVILTVGYMISRGLAKSGSRDVYTDDDSDRH
jgi:hypothetical protein